MAELERTLSARELAEWMAYYGIEPFGEERADLRAGIVASTTANCHLGSNATPLKATDFMPFYEQPAPPSDYQRMQAMFGDRVIKKKPHG